MATAKPKKESAETAKQVPVDLLLVGRAKYPRTEELAKMAAADAPVFLILLLVSLSANAPMLAPYQLVADDYPHFAKTVAEWFETWGVWRIAGIELARGLVAMHVYGIAAIMWHALNGYLFYRVALCAFGSRSFAFFLTGVVTAFPWGYAGHHLGRLLHLYGSEHGTMDRNLRPADI